MSSGLTKNLALIVLFCVSAANAYAERENIVFILTDDQDQHMFESQFMANYMPTLYQLANDGLTFKNYIFTTPLCGPSRASILTGRYAHNTDIKSNTSARENGVPGGFGLFYEKGFADNDVGAQMRRAGYFTIFSGKYHNNRFPDEGTDDIAYTPPGWDAFHASMGTRYIDPVIVHRDPGQATASRYQGSGYRTDIETDAILEFLAAVPETQPFFLYAAPFNVHLTDHPHAIYPSRHAERAWYETWPQTPDVNELDVSDKSSNIRALPLLSPSEISYLDTIHRDRIRSALSVDDMLSRIVDFLRTTGNMDNTIFFFSTDNGFHLGNHRLANKRAPYDFVTRVPLFVSGPGVGQGTRDHLIANIDLLPTFLHIAHRLAPESTDGRSFRNLLDALPAYTPQQWREAVLVEHWEPVIFFGEEVDMTYSGLRLKNEVFIQYRNGDELEEEYYDLTSDPYQMDNYVSSLPPARLTELRDKLQALSVCSGESCRGVAKSHSPLPSGVVNISTRGQVQFDNYLHAGFVIQGGEKTVVVKGLGPTLTDRGVTGALNDPVLTLYSGQRAIAESDGWVISGGCGETGLEPAHGSEPCILRTLEPGSYTAVVRGAGGTSGKAIVSVNDIGGDGSIVNLSTRGRVIPGVEYLTGGFVITDRSVDVLVKALGPTLIDRGVVDTLSDPKLTLYSGQTVIATNDSWPGGSCVGSGLEPDYVIEPCIRTKLAPGAYTAIVTSTDGSAGTAIVSINTMDD